MLTIAWAGMAAANAQAGGQDAPSHVSMPAEEKCHIDGIERWVICGTITVPLDWKAAEAEETLDLFYARVPATRPGGRLPLFVLPGGPGQAASDMGLLADTAFSRINEMHDIILLDQRGTGRSHPLQCPETKTAILEWSAEETASEGERCLAAMDADVRLFTSWSVIRDLEAARKALGYERVMLWGGSFGTRTALLYINEFPGRVEAAILDSVTAPENPIFESAPAHAEAAYRAMVRDCQADAACRKAFPNLDQSTRALLERYAESAQETELTDPVTGETLGGRMSYLQLAETIRSSLYSTDIAAYLPAALDAAAGGNLEPLASVGSLLQQGLSEGMYLGATLAILCSEDMPRTDPARVEAERENSFHGDSYYRFWSAYCRAWPQGYADGTGTGPQGTDTRLLLLSGGLDPVTPPVSAESVAHANPDAIHVIAPHASHIVSTAPCADRLMADFLDGASGEALETDCLAEVSRAPFYIPMHKLTEVRP